MNGMERYKSWLESGYFDEQTRNELMTVKDNCSEIEDRFYKNLEFGTGGLRGVIGAGTNRMNKYVVRRATQGLASYLTKNFNAAKERGVVIAYDSRHMSPDFAMEAARVLAYNGIKAFLFESLRPTPILSFAVRHLKAAAGVVVTASHNPGNYNGYKVYGEDGGQLTPQYSDMVMKEIETIEDIESIGIMDRDKAVSLGLIETIGSQVDQEYMEYLKTLCINPQLSTAAGLKIVYTPLHGTGNIPVRRILAETGFKNVVVVKEQEMPDPDFSTVKYPNPEERSSFEIAIKVAEREDADLIIGTDPDCDRVGVMVKNRDGEFVVLTGNQVGCLLLEYILSQLHRHGKLPENSFVATTIVSTRLTESIAERYGVELVNVLTGFKFIGEKIKELEEYGDKKFIFGFEESYGYLAGSKVRDKDGVSASMLIAEMVSYHKERGLTLYGALQELFEKYGYYLEDIESFPLEGKEGEERISAAMRSLRVDKPTEIGKRAVIGVEDYMDGILKPVSDVLYFQMEDSEWFCIRPSGTEPKIKVYFGTRGNDFTDAQKKLKDLRGCIIDLVRPLLGDMQVL